MPKNLPNSPVKLPAGYIVLDYKDAEKYTLKSGDYFKDSSDDYAWEKVHGYDGYTTYKAFGGRDDYLVAIPKPKKVKPRFKTKKPFPFGY